VIGSYKSNIRAKVSPHACFRAFADRAKSQDHLPLLNLEKLLAEISDYHSLNYSKKFSKIPV
jgi:hypothetical protein